MKFQNFFKFLFVLFFSYNAYANENIDENNGNDEPQIEDNSVDDEEENKIYDTNNEL